MNKIILKSKLKSKIFEVLIGHIQKNKKSYIIICLIFLLGFVMGIMFINNSTGEGISQIGEYTKSLFTNLNEAQQINYTSILKESIIINFILVLVIWIASATIIGIPAVYTEIAFKGFSISYTISSILTTFGIKNGIIYSFAGLFIHNLICIPVLFATAVSGMKMYKSILQNRKKENVKIEFLRHTIFCILMFVLLVIASLVETYISINLLRVTFGFIKM